jgi:predicted aspartyl protease
MRCMVDTGAQYSVLNKPTEPLSKKISLVQGATGSKAYQWTSKHQVDLGRHQVTHSFLVIPECPAPLLGCDLLTKVRAHIHFELDSIRVTDGQGQHLQVLTTSLEDEHRLFSLRDPPPEPIEWPPEMAYWIQTYPQAWAEIAGVGLVKH